MSRPEDSRSSQFVKNYVARGAPGNSSITLWIGVAAVGLPVLVHLLTRPRPVRMPLSTLRFVREAIRQRRARHRLRDVLILALRALAALLVAWAIARPQLGPQPLVSDRQTGVALVHDGKTLEKRQVELTGDGLPQPKRFAPVPSGSDPGQFRVAFGRLAEGRYAARLVAEGVDKAASTAAFDVRGNLAERLDGRSLLGTGRDAGPPDDRGLARSVMGAFAPGTGRHPGGRRGCGRRLDRRLPRPDAPLRQRPGHRPAARPRHRLRRPGPDRGRARSAARRGLLHAPARGDLGPGRDGGRAGGRAGRGRPRGKGRARQAPGPLPGDVGPRGGRAGALGRVPAGPGPHPVEPLPQSLRRRSALFFPGVPRRARRRRRGVRRAARRPGHGRGRGGRSGRDGPGRPGHSRGSAADVPRARRPLAGGGLTLTTSAGINRIPMQPTAGGGSEVLGEFEVTRDGRFQLSVTDVDGQESRESFAGTITLLADERPFLRLIKPLPKSLATPTAAIPVVLSAEDDYGISRVQLFRSLNDSRARPEAESALAEFSGTRGHAKAKEAAEILAKFIRICEPGDAEGIPDLGKLCLVFQPTLLRGLGQTVEQLLGEMGLASVGRYFERIAEESGKK